MNFEDILTSTLEELEKNPNADINELMTGMGEKFSLSKEASKELYDSFECLEKIDECSLSLASARAEGKTRGQWIVEETESMTQNLTQLEKDAVATAIVESVDEQVESMTL